VDEQLLIEAAQKDPTRFAELYEAHVDRIYAYIARRVQDRSTAEDLTSEVFQSALANLPKFEWRGAPFASWLYRMAANAIADRLQQSRREVKDVLPENMPGGEEEIERRVMLFQLVDHLPEDQRRVVIARFVEQKRILEIAQEMDRSEGAIKQLQFRALETLRTHMGRANA
jgi:RNA polymerase sigma-70 factor (ECF subfamily)